MRVAAPADKRFRRAHVRPSRRRQSWLARTIAVGRIAAGLVFLLAGGWLFTQQVAQARSLHVDRIVVRGNSRLPTGDVIALLEGLKGQHVLSVDLEAWRRRVLNSPWVEYASVRRVLPSTIEVAIREREPMALGRVGRDQDLYLVDATGRVIDEFGPNYAQFDLPIVDGLAPNRPGEPAIDVDRAVLANRLIAELHRAPSLEKRVSQISVANDRDAVVLLQGDAALLHVGDEQFAERLQNWIDLAPAVRQQVPEIESVDLRFPNRVYVRPAGRWTKPKRDADRTGR